MDEGRRLLLKAIIATWLTSQKWLSEYFVFKLYFFLAAFVLVGGSLVGAHHFEGNPSATLGQLATWCTLSGLGTWLSLAWVLKFARRKSLEEDLYRNPLEWSPWATAGAITFLLLVTCYSVPLCWHAYDLTPLHLLAAIYMSATGGIFLYQSLYWPKDLSADKSGTDALKAEHAAMVALLSGTVVWSGVFIGGLLLAVSGERLASLFASSYRKLTGQQIALLITLHLFSAFYAVIGVILWGIRAVLRRLLQIGILLDRLSAKA